MNAKLIAGQASANESASTSANGSDSESGRELAAHDAQAATGGDRLGQDRTHRAGFRVHSRLARTILRAARRTSPAWRDYASATLNDDAMVHPHARATVNGGDCVRVSGSGSGCDCRLAAQVHAGAGAMVKGWATRA